MQLILKDNLPFTTVTVEYQGASAEVRNVLIDTGSASSIFSIDSVESIGVIPMPEDVLHLIRGVGGTEVVFQRKIDALKIGAFCLPNFEIEVGGMDYGFEIDAILGMDFLLCSKAIINLKEMRIQFSQ
jgi:hypothetical protein